MRLGAFTHPDEEVRSRAVKIAAEGCEWARELGASELVVWSAFDGYDYHFQVSLHGFMHHIQIAGKWEVFSFKILLIKAWMEGIDHKLM
jgi:L-rhamnose isomerase